MPTISAFFGIAVRMYYNDHAPPHFHAEYQGQRAAFDFSARLIAGEITSKTALRLIAEWTRLHHADLQEDWERARASLPLNYIEPLQ